MSDASLFRVFGVLAILGGLARIAAAVIPWAEQPWLEVLYLTIDMFLLFGLMGVYFAHRGRVGWLGLAGFAVAEVGIASIVGPDTVINGYETYQVGVMVIMIGLTLFSVVLVATRAGPLLAPLCWIASAVVGVSGAIGGLVEVGFTAAGILFGVGFVLAGWPLVSPGDGVKKAT